MLVYYVILSWLSLFDREENSLVEQFVFELLVIFVESLALAHSDERSLGNYSHTSTYLMTNNPALTWDGIFNLSPRYNTAMLQCY